MAKNNSPKWTKAETKWLQSQSKQVIKLPFMCMQETQETEILLELASAA